MQPVVTGILCVCLLFMALCCAKMLQLIKIWFGAWNFGDARNRVLVGAWIPKQIGAVLWDILGED